MDPRLEGTRSRPPISSSARSSSARASAGRERASARPSDHAAVRLVRARAVASGQLGAAPRLLLSTVQVVKPKLGLCQGGQRQRLVLQARACVVHDPQRLLLDLDRLHPLSAREVRVAEQAVGDRAREGAAGSLGDLHARARVGEPVADLAAVVVQQSRTGCGSSPATRRRRARGRGAGHGRSVVRASSMRPFSASSWARKKVRPDERR